jgi:GxxExxY protein
MTRILHKQLSYEIVGVLMDVHSDLGPGWNEHDYHRAVLEGLKTKGLHANGKLGGRLLHRDILADAFELDILVERRVILELKHLDHRFADAHFVQIINYLKFWRKDLGILVDFGQESLRYQRVPYTPVEGELRLEGPWPKLRHADGLADKVVAMFQQTLQMHGLGYGVETNRKLFRTECLYQDLPCRNPSVRLKYRDFDLGLREARAFLVGTDVLVTIAAHPDTTTAKDAARLRSYMKQLGLSQGVLANFGKTVLTLRAMTAK